MKTTHEQNRFGSGCDASSQKVETTPSSVPAGHKSRFTFHVSRFTPHASSSGTARPACASARSHRAFTLIEMLVVIAIIAILAAMIVPLASVVTKKQRVTRAKTEMEGIKAALDNYQSKRGHYPPDNPGNPAINQLFYELTGTYYMQTNRPRVFERLSGGEKISDDLVQSCFGVDGFVNSSYLSPSLTGPERADALKGVEARDFFQNLSSRQYQQYQTNNASIALLGVPIEGPLAFTSVDGKLLNPWNYNSSNPTNNPNSYDLWMDIILGNKTNRICNWRESPVVLQ